MKIGSFFLTFGFGFDRLRAVLAKRFLPGIGLIECSSAFFERMFRTGCEQPSRFRSVLRGRSNHEGPRHFQKSYRLLEKLHGADSEESAPCEPAVSAIT